MTDPALTYSPPHVPTIAREKAGCRSSAVKYSRYLRTSPNKQTNKQLSVEFGGKVKVDRKGGREAAME